MKSEGYGGIVYGLGTPSGDSCLLLPTGGGIDIILDGTPRAHMDYGSVAISVTGTGNKYLNFEVQKDGAKITAVTTDKEIVSHIEAMGAPRQAMDQLHRAVKIRSRHHLGGLSILIGLGAVLLLIVIGLWAGYHSAIGMVADNIPVDWEVEIGKSQSESILSENDVCTDPELNAAVQELGSRLAMGMGNTPYQWHIRVVDSDEVNAFALPGGYVFINRGLIEKSDDGYEVAGVLAHEFQHVLGRHGIRNVIANLGLMLVLYAVIGDADAVQRFLYENLASLAAMSFSRDQETDADLKGMELIYKAKLEPTGLMRFMGKLSAEEGELGAALSIVSTHPGSANRAEQLNALIEAWGPPEVVPLKSDWKRIRTLCSPGRVEDPDAL